MNLELKDMTLDEIIDQLTKIKTMLPDVRDWKVRIGWTNGEGRSCVGKILALSHNDTQEGTVFLFPVPENIANINAVVSLMTSMTCPKRTQGVKCESCDELAACEHMKAIDTNIRIHQEAANGHD